MADQTDTAAPEPSPAPEAPAAAWNPEARAAAEAVLQRLAIEASPERIDHVLQVALWRRSCAALLEARETLAAATPPPDEAELTAQLLNTMGEAALLAVIADNPAHEERLLHQSCQPFVRQVVLLDLAMVIRRGAVTCDPASLAGVLAALPGTLDGAEVRAASGDPAFLLQILLLSGSEETAKGVADTVFHIMRQGARPAAFAGAAALLAEAGGDADPALFLLMQRSAEAGVQALAGQPITWNLPEIETCLDAVEHALDGPLRPASLLAIYIREHRVNLLSMLAIDARLPPDARESFVGRAIAAIEALRAQIRAVGQSEGLLLTREAQLVWAVCELAPAAGRAQARGKAIERLVQLLADAAHDDNGMPRLHAMASVLVLLATAYYETGQLQVAAHQAELARRLAHDAQQQFAAQAAKIGQADDPNVAVARSGYETLVAQADRAAMIARARLAESRGAFAQAADIYVEAVAVERGIRDRAQAAIKALYGEATEIGGLPDTVARAEAQAALFAAMATMSRADALLMEGDHAGAITAYGEAGKGLSDAALMWDAARARLLAGPQQNDAALQAELGRLRARYCDCKIALAEAERRVAAGQHLGAAEKFIAAGTVLKELVLRSQDVDDPRNQQILLATRHYAEARGLFEIDLDAGTDGNLARARDLVGEAARQFAAAGETRWATFIRAQAAQSEAEVLRSRAALSAQSQLRAALQARATERTQDAQGLFELAGGGMARGDDDRFGALVPPRPAPAIAAARPAVRVAADHDADVVTVRAELDAVEDTIRILDAQLDRGALDPARHASLSTAYKQQANLLRHRLGMGST